MSKDGGQAFPTSRAHFAPEGKLLSVDWLPGMSLRDWFAGMALQGFCANVNLHGQDVGVWIGDATARDAYSYADAMIAERSKEAE